MHYYHGFKLLGLNAKISFKLALKKMNGHELTRREHNLVSYLKYSLEKTILGIIYTHKSINNLTVGISVFFIYKIL